MKVYLCEDSLTQDFFQINDFGESRNICYKHVLYVLRVSRIRHYYRISGLLSDFSMHCKIFVNAVSFLNCRDFFYVKNSHANL